MENDHDLIQIHSLKGWTRYYVASQLKSKSTRRTGEKGPGVTFSKTGEPINQADRFSSFQNPNQPPKQNNLNPMDCLPHPQAAPPPHSQS